MPPIPNAIDLTTLVRVKRKAEVGIQPNGTIATTFDDQEIQDAITAFSQWLLDFTEQGSLNSIGAYDEMYDGNGNTRLFLRSYPIVNLTAVIINGVNVPLSTGPTVWGAFLEQSKKSIGIRGGGGNFQSFPYAGFAGGPYGRNALGCGPNFILGQGNVEVKYTAGYPPTPVVNEIDNVTAQTITLQQAPWAVDDGVLYYPSLEPLVEVSNSPTVGEYAVSEGLYVFNAGDDGELVAVSYGINQAPFDLEYAVRCVVAINYKRKGWQDQGSRSTSAGGGSSATTRYQNWAWPPEYDKVFEKYQRKALYA